MCLKSNETGAINLFINNWTTNQHYPFQSSSLGKPHTAWDVASTPGSSAGIHVEVPSACLSRPFGCCTQFQNYYLWGGMWVSGKGRSHTVSDQASVGAPKPLKYTLWSKLLSRRWQFDGEHCRNAASNFAQIFRMPNSSVQMLWTVWWFKFNSLPIILIVKRRSDLTRALTFGHVFVRFWRARSSRTRFVFYDLTAIQNCFM